MHYLLRTGGRTVRSRTPRWAVETNECRPKRACKCTFQNETVILIEAMSKSNEINECKTVEAKRDGETCSPLKPS